MQLEINGDGYLVWSNDVRMYGIGKTISSAMKDFACGLDDLWMSLRNDPDSKLYPNAILLRDRLNAIYKYKRRAGRKKA
jgi:hypothetical protein